MYWVCWLFPALTVSLMASPGFDAFDLSFTLFGNTNLSFARSAVAEQYSENFSVSSQKQDDFDIPIDFGVEKYESQARWSGNWTQHYEETETGVTLIIEGILDPANSASVTTDFEQIAASGTMNGFLALGIRPSYPVLPRNSSDLIHARIAASLW
ncbi:hypothetical protein [Cerasicoccus frondis]|uniref:hypothetical protein n=1 Tax=Cerasicoccus frondis TaxID=490090 RepID=UPI002852A9CC|nr:hypothetical protein [Cerasicoccus frondis]